MPVFGAGGQERNKSSLPKQEAVKRSRSNNPTFCGQAECIGKISGDLPCRLLSISMP